VFPKHDHLCIEKFVERNAPRAFGPPQGRAQADKPRTVVCAVRCVVFLHGLVLSFAQPQVYVAPLPAGSIHSSPRDSSVTLTDLAVHLACARGSIVSQLLPAAFDRYRAAYRTCRSPRSLHCISAASRSVRSLALAVRRLPDRSPQSFYGGMRSGDGKLKG